MNPEFIDEFQFYLVLLILVNDVTDYLKIEISILLSSINTDDPADDDEM